MHVPLPGLAVAGACVALAVASLALPATASFDAWAWLVWGREAGRLDLDTTGGPSWKPLPVVVTAALSPFGDAAPTLWLVASRAAGLALLVGAFRLAARFAGPVAGLLAVALLLLTPDAEPRFVRTLLEGHDAPLSAALAVWAVERHLAGRQGLALALGTALALLRPESWPVLALYGLWLWRSEPGLRPGLVVSAAAVPLLWFGGDWWGSGDPWHGADLARIAAGGPVETLVRSLGTAAAVVVAPAWVAAAAAVVLALRRQRAALPLAGAAAVAWCAVVVAMAVTLQYAAISRFFLPAGALLCVLAGVGTVWLWQAAPPGRRRVGLVAVALAASAPFVVPRVLGLEAVAEEVRTRATLSAELPEAIEKAGGAAAILRCPQIAVSGWTHMRPALAWLLDVPLHRVRLLATQESRSVVFVVTGDTVDRHVTALPPADRRVLARTDSWTVHALGCPRG